MNRKLLAIGLLAALASGSATALTQTDTMAVTITIQNACTIAVTDDIDFGTQSEVNTTAWQDTGTIDVNCTAVAPITVDLDAGTSPVGGATDFANRRMTDAVSGDQILYTIRSATAGGGSVLGDGTGGSSSVFTGNSTGNSALQQFTVHGITATGQGAKSAGTYDDTVTATVTY